MIVVTGAAGFVGTHVLRLLVARGEQVVGIDRCPVGVPGVDAITTDLARGGPGPADDALHQADAVVHLAALPGVRAAGLSPTELAHRRHLDNVGTVRRVLARVPATTPLVVASSSSVYGSGSAGRASRETDRPRPLGAYARSKLAVERHCTARAASGGLVTVVRPFTVAGEGQRPDMALDRWLRAAVQGRCLDVLGGLERSRDVTDVRQVAAAIVRAAERSPVGTVNLGTGRPRTLGELVEAVGTVLGLRPRVRLLPRHTEEADGTWADTTRCRRWLDIQLETDLTALVARQAAAAFQDSNGVTAHLAPSGRSAPSGAHLAHCGRHAPQTTRSAHGAHP